MKKFDAAVTNNPSTQGDKVTFNRELLPVP